MSKTPATHPPWSGRRVTEAHALVGTWLPAPCGQCGETVNKGEPYVTGHKVPRWERPDLTWDPRNWRPEHKACSDRTGQREVIRKARAEGARQATQGSPSVPPPHDGEGSARPRILDAQGRVFPSTESSKESPLLPIYLSDDHEGPATTREDLEWNPDALARYEWLRPFLDVPEDASPPLWMSRPPEDAVGSYGAQAIAWIEESQKITLRWWQALAITRQLEHREDGSLCHREIIESTPRRAGKSVRMRVVALWRLRHGPQLFGETQLVMHTGSDLPICREIQRQAWPWSYSQRWTVTKANGREAIETKDGDRWLVRAQGAVYGYDVTLAIVDEAWDVSPECVAEGIEPATLERRSPQVHMTSTAHRRATSLMRGRISAALAAEDPQTLVLIWAARFGSDPSDPEVWRTASPHWTEDRRKLIASKHAKALAGEEDQELDDPDPMAGFTSQFLNVWRLSERRQTRGAALTTRREWEELATTAPSRRPDAAAIESWFSDGVALVLGWRVGGRAVVAATDHPDLTGAATCLRDSGFRGRVTVGASLVDDPALAGIRTTPGQGRTAPSVAELRRLLDEDALRHDGGEALTEQVLTVRTVAGADGPRMSSSGRADAIKAATWVAAEVRRAGVGRPRIVLPRSA